jgi:hypothetical protein
MIVLHRFVVEIGLPGEAQSGATETRHHQRRLGHDAGRGSQSDQQQLIAVVGETSDGSGRPCWTVVAVVQQDGDEDDVVGDRAEHGSPETTAGVEQGGPQADEAVTGQLGNEEHQQLGGHPPVLCRLGRMVQSGGGVDDERGQKQEQHRRRGHHDQRDRCDGRDGVPGLVVGPRRQALDEDRDERGRQDAARDTMSWMMFGNVLARL